jgi:tetratricopeptide (TPR) repeat protein
VSSLNKIVDERHENKIQLEHQLNKYSNKATYCMHKAYKSKEQSLRLDKRIFKSIDMRKYKDIHKITLNQRKHDCDAKVYALASACYSKAYKLYGLWGMEHIDGYNLREIAEVCIKEILDGEMWEKCETASGNNIVKGQQLSESYDEALVKGCLIRLESVAKNYEVARIMSDYGNVNTAYMMALACYGKAEKIYRLWRRENIDGHNIREIVGLCIKEILEGIMWETRESGNYIREEQHLSNAYDEALQCIGINQLKSVSEMMLKYHPNHPLTFIIEADLQGHKSEWEQAIIYYRRALRVYKETVDILKAFRSERKKHNEMNIYMYDSALSRCAEHSADIKSYMSHVPISIGECYERLGKFDNAAETYKAYLTENPESVEALSALYRLTKEQGAVSGI